MPVEIIRRLRMTALWLIILLVARPSQRLLKMLPDAFIFYLWRTPWRSGAAGFPAESGLLVAKSKSFTQ
ncbi:MAG: hypothetical protein DMG82_09055 [Acidobacteria bacterium]|nr:MAG: hypothetical protein DMG82_09055 [Acidobacteriota bacterium]PYX43082.1 MAG: hypothetical protein DMG83_18595 [Acidobacteriota bacterium]